MFYLSVSLFFFASLSVYAYYICFMQKQKKNSPFIFRTVQCSQQIATASDMMHSIVNLSELTGNSLDGYGNTCLTLITAMCAAARSRSLSGTSQPKTCLHAIQIFLYGIAHIYFITLYAVSFTWLFVKRHFLLFIRNLPLVRHKTHQHLPAMNLHICTAF